MKAASTQLIAAIDGASTTLCRLWTVTRSDGVVLRFTDSDRPVVLGANTYRSDVSFTSSSIFTSAQAANLQSVTMTVIMDDTAFAEEDLRRQLYQKAQGVIEVCDYANPAFGTLVMFSGKFGQIQIGNNRTATIEIIPDAAAAASSIIAAEKYSQTCRANLGDTRCKLNIEGTKVAFTVVSASAGSLVATELNQASDHWVLGKVKWVTGANAGSISFIQSGDQGTTSLFLLSPPFKTIQAGDTGFAYVGCDKQLGTCRVKFDNVVNFRGEPTIPPATADTNTMYATNTGVNQGA